MVGPPRAGARLVADVLAAAPGCWSPGRAADALLAPVLELDPPDGAKNGRLDSADCTPGVRQRLRAQLQLQFAEHEGAPKRRRSSSGHAVPRLLHGSPRNALLVPFLGAAFPDAAFVYVHRQPADAIRESLLLWRAGSATTYPDLPGWTGPAWSFLLVPGWQELIGRPLAEIVTEQWVRTMDILTRDLEERAPGRWGVVAHDALRPDAPEETTRLIRYLCLEPPAPVTMPPTTIRFSSEGLSAALAELEPYLDRTRALADRAANWLADPQPQDRGI